MISVKKMGALKKGHYVNDAKLYSALHHFFGNYIDVQGDGLQVVLKGGAEPSAATATSKTDTKAWREALEAKCAEKAQQRGPALVQLANVASNAQQAAERDVARLRADLDLARAAPYDVRNFEASSGAIDPAKWEQRGMTSIPNMPPSWFVL